MIWNIWLQLMTRVHHHHCHQELRYKSLVILWDVFFIKHQFLYRIYMRSYQRVRRWLRDEYGGKVILLILHLNMKSDTALRYKFNCKFVILKLLNFTVYSCPVLRVQLGVIIVKISSGDSNVRDTSVKVIYLLFLTRLWGRRTQTMSSWNGKWLSTI